MARIAVALVVEVLLAILVALGLGTALQWMLGAGGLAAAAAESARLLFFFMDIGLAVWVVILIVLVVRRRTHPTVGATLFAAVVGVVVNALTVTVVGFVQGGWTPLFVIFAIDAGVAFLIAVLVVAPIIRRIFRAPVKPPA